METEQKIYTIDEIKKAYPKAYTPWTPQEDELLKQACWKFVSPGNEMQLMGKQYIFTLAQQFERQSSAIRSRMAKLFAAKKPLSASSKEEDKETSVTLVPKKMIELNEQFRYALGVMERTYDHMFITGKAGSGKSTLIEYFRRHTKKKVVVLAPTGVAALNVHGQTIHSFFHFKPGITRAQIRKLSEKYNREIYKKIDAIIIDEVSMVRADLLDCIDRFMRLNGKDPMRPFGGVQIILVGDLYQLPPVVTPGEQAALVGYESPYFFDSHVVQQVPFTYVELEKIYRQREESFVELLNAIRNNSVTEQQLEQLNTRFDPSFKADPQDFYVYLATINKIAERVNQWHLDKLTNKLFTYTGTIKGEVDNKSLPTDKELSLKVGAQVMMLNNDMAGRWVNGSIGKITGIIANKQEGYDEIIVELSEGKRVKVAPHSWEFFQFVYKKDNDDLTSEKTGSFIQYPLMLAWAVTIHKSQGKTFDKVVVDIGYGSFAHGQVYVALSRSRSFGGLILKKPIQRHHIFIDNRVLSFIVGNRQTQLNMSN